MPSSPATTLTNWSSRSAKSSCNGPVTMISMSFPSNAVRIGEPSGSSSTNASYSLQGTRGTRIRVSAAGGLVARVGGFAMVVLMVLLCSCLRPITASVSPVEQIYRVNHLDRGSPFLDLAGDLEDAADVAGGDDRGAGGFDVVHLPPAQALGHFGLGQVVRTRGAAAKLALLQRDELEAGDHRQKLPGLAANLLRMAEVASVVIGH